MAVPSKTSKRITAEEAANLQIDSLYNGIDANIRRAAEQGLSRTNHQYENISIDESSLKKEYEDRGFGVSVKYDIGRTDIKYDIGRTNIKFITLRW
jgi:hypothetical protein